MLRRALIAMLPALGLVACATPMHDVPEVGAPYNLAYEPAAPGEIVRFTPDQAPPGN